MAKAKTAPVQKGGKTVKVITETIEEREESGDEVELESGSTVSVDEADEADVDALADLDALAGNGARYEIRRTSPASHAGYVGTYYRDTFTPDLLRSEWGGGHFNMRVKNSKGEFVGSRQIVLAGEAKHKRDPDPVVPATSGVGELGAILTAMQKSNEGQVALLTSLVTGLISRPLPAAPPAPDPLAMIGALKDILKPSKGDGETSAISLFMKGVDFGKSVAGDGGETNMMDLFAKGFDTIKEAAAHAPAQPVPRPVARLPAPGTVPATEPATAPPNNANGGVKGEPPVSNQMKQIQWIRQQCVFLVHQARRGKEAALYAELFLDNLPDFLPVELVAEQMQDAGAVQKLGMLHAPVLEFAAWFEEFRLSIVEMLEGGEEDASPDPGEEDAGMNDPEPGPSGDAGDM